LDAKLARKGRGAMARSKAVNRRRGREQGTLHGAPIEDYALIGDCETAALVSRAGSIDWLCWPSFSSPACFAALLGTCDHGYWKIAPKHKVTRSQRRYREGTLIVETVFETAEGQVCVTDFMPPRRTHSQLVRLVRAERGSVRMRMDLAIRFDYGRTVPWVTSSKAGGVHQLRAVAGSDMVVLETKARLQSEDRSTYSEFTLRKGQTMAFTLTYCSSLGEAPKASLPMGALAHTQSFWARWLGQSTYCGPYGEAVARSLMTLKAMTYRPTGGIVAAVTASLPEKVGGARNWDYRFCWLRDTAFTLLVLLHAGYRDEALAWRRWLLRAVAGSPDQVQTIYGLAGERDMVEWEATWLPGYEHSQPVRIGNGAAGQFQLDVYGEVASALARMPQAEDDIRVSASGLQRALANHLIKVWRKPDQGLWEVRGGPKHFVHSKVMAWVALDRAVRFFEENKAAQRSAGARQMLQRDLRRWKRVRAQIHREVCAKGFDKRRNCFVQAYGPGSTPGALDASCLRIALVGFLPADDPRIAGTVEAIERRLMKDGFVQRYKTRQTDDGLAGGEGQFLACSFWMAANLWLIGRRQDAKELFDRLLALRNDVGLLSEEYDSGARRMVGNFPQALSHIALIHAAFTLSGSWAPQTDSAPEKGATKARVRRT